MLRKQKLRFGSWAFFLLLRGPVIAYGQGGGPPGGDVRAIAIDTRNPATLYAGTVSGVFKSMNGGASWAGTSLVYAQIWALAIDPANPQVVYAGASGGLFKTANGGVSWSTVETGFHEENISALVIDPSNPATVYAATWSPGPITSGSIYKSTNGGASWARNPMPCGGDVLGLAMHPQTPKVLYALFENNFVCRTVDGGDNWSRLSWITGEGLATSLALDPISETTVYVGFAGTGIFKSVDAGATWGQSNGGLTNLWVSALASDPRNRGTLYACTNDGRIPGGVFKTTSAGAGWSAIGLPYTRISVLAVDPGSSATLYAGTEGGGVLKSTNAGVAWSAVNNGLANAGIQALAIDPKNSAIVYAGGWGGAFKSADGGASWTTATTGLTIPDIMSLAINPKDPVTLYAGTFSARLGSWSDLYADVFKSEDAGAAWRAANTGLPRDNAQTVISALAVDPSNPATLYAAIWSETRGGGVYKSINAGATWSAASTGIEEYNRELMSIAIAPSNSAVLYAGTDHGGVFKSTDGGASWTSIGPGERTVWVSVWALAVDPLNPATVYAGTKVYSGAWPDVVYKTTDGGNNWILANTGLPGQRIKTLAVDPANPKTLYTGTWNSGVFKSTNAGDSWNAANTGLPYLDINALAIDPSNPATLYAATSSAGVFKSTDGGACWQPTGPTARDAALRPAVNEGGVVNNASFAPGPARVAPGSMAAVFGTNLNNGSSVYNSCLGPDGKLVSSLGDTLVTINNIPAPLFYSTPGQLGVQIPFELAGQTSATIQVTVGRQTSLTRTVLLDSFAPGIFTMSQSGSGAAAALHQDGVTPVSAQNPARPGEAVALFATGLGPVAPSLATGAPSTGNRTLAIPTVTIDGTLAGVEFSGAAPGFAALNQINVRIPPSTRSASDIPVVLSIGGMRSNEVTIAVSTQVP